MFNWLKSWWIKESTYLDDLPDDILQSIGNYLSISEIKNVLTVINREGRLEYIIPESRIMNNQYPFIWQLLLKNEDKWNNKHPSLPVNRNLLLKQLSNIVPDSKILTDDILNRYLGGNELDECVKFNLSEMLKLILLKEHIPIVNYKFMAFDNAMKNNKMEIIKIFLIDIALIED